MIKNLKPSISNIRSSALLFCLLRFDTFTPLGGFPSSRKDQRHKLTSMAADFTALLRNLQIFIPIFTLLSQRHI